MTMKANVCISTGTEDQTVKAIHILAPLPECSPGLCENIKQVQYVQYGTVHAYYCGSTPTIPPSPSKLTHTGLSKKMCCSSSRFGRI